MPVTIVHPFQVTIPAGTLKATPLVTPTTFPPNVVDRIEWLFPHGCNGTVGIQIGARSTSVIPGDPNQWFVRSGDSAGLNPEDMHTTGDWSVIGYNTGSFQHIVYVTFYVHRYVTERPLPAYLAGDTVDMLNGGY